MSTRIKEAIVEAIQSDEDWEDNLDRFSQFRTSNSSSGFGGFGYGVFAGSELKKGAFLGEYTGVIQEAEEIAGQELDEGGFESDYSWYYLEEIEQAPTLEINGRFEGNELRYVNHGNEPNVDVEHALIDGYWVLFFKTARKINAEEQLLISYVGVTAPPQLAPRMITQF